MIEWDILVILDRSGSMEHARKDHEGGLRSFVEDQRSMPGDVRFTLVQFDTQAPCEIVYDRVPIDTVGLIQLVPRGGTPLLDAIGKAVAHLRTRQAQQPASQTLVIIVTDGEENSSREWTVPLVKTLLTDLEQAGGKVLYLGANVDAFAEAGAVGVASAHAVNYTQTTGSVGAVYAATSGNTLRARQRVNRGASGMSVSAAFNYSDEQRQAISGEENEVFTTSTTATKE